MWGLGSISNHTRERIAVCGCFAIVVLILVAVAALILSTAGCGTAGQRVDAPASSTADLQAQLHDLQAQAVTLQQANTQLTSTVNKLSQVQGNAAKEVRGNQTANTFRLEPDATAIDWGGDSGADSVGADPMGHPDPAAPVATRDSGCGRGHPVGNQSVGSWVRRTPPMTHLVLVGLISGITAALCVLYAGPALSRLWSGFKAFAAALKQSATPPAKG